MWLKGQIESVASYDCIVLRLSIGGGLLLFSLVHVEALPFYLCVEIDVLDRIHIHDCNM